MNWLEQMEALQQRLVAKGVQTISDELYRSVMLFRDARAEVAKLAMKTANTSPFWGNAELIMLPPSNPSLVVYLAMKEVAVREQVPLTWLYLLPFKLNIDSAAHQIAFKGGAIRYTNEEGEANHEAVLAFHDGKEAGLIDQDEEFIFIESKFAKKYVNEVEESLKELSLHLGVTKEQAQSIADGTHIDAPFPCENDDSPWGDA